MGPRSRETTYIIAVTVVEGYGRSELGEGEDGCGAISGFGFCSQYCLFEGIVHSEPTHWKRPTRRAKTRRGKHSKLAVFEGVVRLVDWVEVIVTRRERRITEKCDNRFILIESFMLAS